MHQVDVIPEGCIVKVGTYYQEACAYGSYQQLHIDVIYFENSSSSFMKQFWSIAFTGGHKLHQIILEF